MFPNIYKKLSEKQFILRKYIIDKNIFSAVRNIHNEWTYCRCLSITFKPTKTDKYSLNALSKNAQRYNTNFAVAEETRFIKTNLLTSLNTEVTDDDIEKLLSLDWSSISSGEFISNFAKFSLYTNKLQETPNINFDNLLQGLSVLSSNFSLEELSSILQYTCFWNRRINELESIREKILKTIDTELSGRLPKLEIENIFMFCSLFSRTKFVKKSKFASKALFKLSRKVKNMGPSQVAKFMSLLTTCVNLPMNFYNIEYAIENKWDSFSKDELRRILLSFLRNDYRIKNKDSRLQIFKLVLNNIEETSSQNLGVFAKYLCTIYKSSEEFDDILKKILISIEPKVEQFAITTLINVLVLAAHALMHENTLITSILKRINEDLHNISIPNIERISCSMAAFNYDSNHPLYPKILEELNSSSREEEIAEHNKAFVRTLQNLAFVNIYPTNLIEKILNPIHIEQNYKTRYVMDDSFYFLDQSIAAELPSYTGPVLSDKLRKYFAKPYKFTSIMDKKNVSYIKTEVLSTCERILNTSVYMDQILPHYLKKDYIICLDKNNNPISPEPFLSILKPEVVKPLSEEARNYKWFVLIITSWNMLQKNSEDFSGILASKCRQLKSLGYTPIVISYREWYAEKNEEHCEKYREDYIRNLLNIK